MARSPMRPEVLQMGKTRELRRKLGKNLFIQDTNLSAIPLNVGKIFSQDVYTPMINEQITELLLGKELHSAISLVKEALNSKQIDPLMIEHPRIERRKLVVCYFRDRNGDALTNALLRSGFDVLLFERGYHKGFSDHKTNDAKVGRQWVVNRKHEKNPSITDQHLLEVELDHNEGNRTTNQEREQRVAYWERILRQNTGKLLGVDTEVTGHDIDTVVSLPQVLNKTNFENERNLVSAFIQSQSLPPPRIIRITDMNLFVPLLSIADGVASSAGSQLLSECLYSHMPVLALYRENDGEQRLNIEMIRHKFGFGTVPENKNSNTKEEGVRSQQKHHQNVIRGMSIERFSNTFSSILNGDSKQNENGKLLTEAEETLFIRSSEAKEAYNDFNAYVNIVRKSVISRSYYHDLFASILKRSSTVMKERDFEQEENTGNDEDIAEYADPFQGMPEASAVILEIINELKLAFIDHEGYHV